MKRRFLRDIIFGDQPQEVGQPELGSFRVRPYQIILWISLSHRGARQLAPEAPRLPAILDTGHNHNFSLREAHLRSAGFDPRDMRWSDKPLRVRDASNQEWDVPRLFVDVWLHSNLSRWTNRPYALRLGNIGVACYLTGGPVPGPYLPLLGLRALCAGALTVQFQCDPVRGTLNAWIPA